MSYQLVAISARRMDNLIILFTNTIQVPVKYKKNPAEVVLWCRVFLDLRLMIMKYTQI